MKMLFKIVAIFIFIGCLVSCNSSKQEETTRISQKVNLLDTAKWFIGTWENRTTEDVYAEAWCIKNDSVYEGISTVVEMHKDTVFFESITLEQKGDELFYIVSVKDQNYGKPVSFKLTSVTDQQLVFENPQHDFPTKISYNRITADSLIATISGSVGGKDKKDQFPMKKIK